MSEVKQVEFLQQTLINNFSREQLRNMNRERQLPTGHQKKDSAFNLAKHMVG